jgi:hypothetical protein
MVEAAGVEPFKSEFNKLMIRLQLSGIKRKIKMFKIFKNDLFIQFVQPIYPIFTVVQNPVS